MLQGTRVLELASVLAGPSVGQFLAELGAEVIKIENPHSEGDVTRQWTLAGEEPGITSYFTATNWGKRSVAIDLKKEEGRALIYELVQQCDFVIASYKPGDAQKYGMDAETLQKYNPLLIYGSITGYGSKSMRTGYDAIIQAESGFMYINGEKGGNPVKLPVALMDILAGHQLKEALLLGYIQRLKTGKGSSWEVSLWEAAMSSLFNQSTSYLTAGRNPERMGTEHPNIVPYGTLFTTKDEKQLLLAVGSDSQFAKLCALLGKPEWAEDPRFATNPQRVTHRDALLPLLSAEIQKQEAKVLLQQLEAEHIPAGLLQDVATALQQLSESMLWQREQYGKSLKAVRHFVGHSPTRPDFSHLAPPPALGADTITILNQWLGKTGDEMQEMLNSGIIL